VRRATGFVQPAPYGHALRDARKPLLVNGTGNTVVVDSPPPSTGRTSALTWGDVAEAGKTVVKAVGMLFGLDGGSSGTTIDNSSGDIDAEVDVDGNNNPVCVGNNCTAG